MGRAIAGAFTVNSLRARDDYLLNRQLLLAYNFKHLRRAERIDVNKFRDLGHVTAVSGLMKYEINLVERGGDRVAIAQIALDEFRIFVNPRWLAATVRLRLQIVESAHLPPFAHEKIDGVRADQARAASD